MSLHSLIAVLFLGIASASAQPPQSPAAPGSPSETVSARCAALLRESEAFIRAQNFPAAISSSQRATGICADPRDAWLLMARAQMLSKQFDAAVRSFHTVLASDPANVSALLLLGETQYLMNHDDEARSSFQKAMAAAPNQPEPHYYLGRMDYADGRIQDAVDQFQSAIRLDGTFYKAYDNLGLCYEAQQHNGLAMESYSKALGLVYKDHPEYDSVYLNLAEFMLKLGNNRKAFDLAEEAASRVPGNPRSYFLAGKALDRDGHDDLSLRWLQKAAQMDPAYPDPHYLLARIYRKQGRQADAEAEAATFQKLLKSAPAVPR
jgi:tetratricopeptide (TPR) repeat protein